MCGLGLSLLLGSTGASLQLQPAYGCEELLSSSFLTLALAASLSLLSLIPVLGCLWFLVPVWLGVCCVVWWICSPGDVWHVALLTKHLFSR